MPVLDVEKDLDQHTLTVTAEFAAPVERVWALYADRELIQRHWGPPGWPATFVRHDFVPGGGSHYYMTGPDGEQPHGVWRITEVDEPRSFALDDAFADADGHPDEETGWSHMAAALEPTADGTRVVFVTTFQSGEQLQQMLEMGMEEGLKQAMGQIDGILAEDPATV
ncbi:SRPBCC domain-containing protein [uncultured Amnibacterium sp.]|uniref:SRPBCC family protein n=1 Tax=uncultured Amnibacterium sp. TaxID=1631851 RepID=UPI0035CC1CB9